jgi:SAM-dependent methyltransferase
MEPISRDPSDPTRFYYLPFTSYFYRGRLELVSRLMDARPVESLLEIGYGSGIFLPHLRERCRRLVALEFHGDPGCAVRVATAAGGGVRFVTGRIESLPFPDETFDAVTCISVAEHTHDPAATVADIRRVLRVGGRAFFGVPIENLALRAFFGLVGFQADLGHPSKYPEIIAAIRSAFDVERELRFPFGLPLPYCLYVGLRCARSR